MAIIHNICKAKLLEVIQSHKPNNTIVDVSIERSIIFTHSMVNIHLCRKKVNQWDKINNPHSYLCPSICPVQSKHRDSQPTQWVPAILKLAVPQSASPTSIFREGGGKALLLIGKRESRCMVWKNPHLPSRSYSNVWFRTWSTRVNAQRTLLKFIS